MPREQASFNTITRGTTVATQTQYWSLANNLMFRTADPDPNDGKDTKIYDWYVFDTQVQHDRIWDAWEMWDDVSAFMVFLSRPCCGKKPADAGVAPMVGSPAIRGCRRTRGIGCRTSPHGCWTNSAVAGTIADAGTTVEGR